MALSLPSIKLRPDVRTPMLSDLRSRRADSPGPDMLLDSPISRTMSLPSLRSLDLLPSTADRSMCTPRPTPPKPQPETSLGWHMPHLLRTSSPNPPIIALPCDDQLRHHGQRRASLDASRMTLEDTHDEGYDSSVSTGSAAFSGLTSESSKAATPPPSSPGPADLPESLSILAEVAQASLEHDKRAARRELEAAHAHVISRANAFHRQQQPQLPPRTPHFYASRTNSHLQPHSAASPVHLYPSRVSASDSRSPNPHPLSASSHLSPLRMLQSGLGPHRRLQHHRSRLQYTNGAPPSNQLRDFSGFDNHHALERESQDFGGQEYEALSLRNRHSLQVHRAQPDFAHVSRQTLMRQRQQQQQLGMVSLDPMKSGSSSDRPFSCSGCDRTFARRYDRNRHARKHTGEKPYQCLNPECGEDFGRPDALQRHYRARPECEMHKSKRTPSPGAESRSSDSTE
ncbi:MAG: Metallothionein expression activator [Cyphobasidiales sp. Tagirdzhanova-0007]|nr:MAG: Metallothionein expression activator [Cyphobasidiales sp. Tagirdzhanova-0007]